MKITAILGAIAGNDYNSTGVLKIIYDTMHEIGENVNIINLVDQNLPYCSNSFVQGTFSSIEKEINSSDGVIFITTSNLFAPCAIMQNFLEHLSQPVYKNTLKNKNCMIIAVSNVQDVSSTINYLSKVVNYLGGFDSVKIPLNYSITKNISEDDKILIEKYAEDYYRYVKQGRKFFTTNHQSTKATQQLVQPAGGVFQKPVAQNTTIPTPQVDKPVSPLFNTQNNTQSAPTFNSTSHYTAYDTNAQIADFYKAQEDDILEITKSLSNRMTKPTKPTHQPHNNNNFGVKDIFNNELTNFNTSNISPTTLNARQMTQNLTHYFQPHLSDGLVCNVALNITGNESFDGTIKINTTSCDYIDGQMPGADVIITATDDVWKQIVKGQNTTQRAFMTGQIKVRGNFVLLSKFDSIFKR